MTHLGERCNKYSVTIKQFTNPPDYTIDAQTAAILIEETIGFKTNRAKELSACEIPDRLFSTVFTKVDENVEVLTVSAEEFMRIRGDDYKDPRLCSSYDMESGRIFIVKETSCYSQLIHEILHSRSSFSRPQFFAKNLKFIFEGLTELFVGIVLKSKLHQCYEDWRIVSPKNPCFSSMYLDFLKPWQFLYQKISYKKIFDVYFNVQAQNPFSSLDTVLRELIGAGYDFSFSQNISQRALFFHFKDALESVYGEDFAESQSSVIEVIDL